jgi:hypothetical protein
VLVRSGYYAREEVGPLDRQSGFPVELVVPAKAPADSLKLVAYDYATDLTGSLNVKVSH